MGTSAEIDAGQYGVCIEHSGIDVYGWVGAGGINHGAKRRPGEKAAAFIRDVGSVCDYISIITTIGFAICGWGLSVVFREISAFADAAAVGAGDGISGDTADTGNGDGEHLAASGSICYSVTKSSWPAGWPIVCVKHVRSGDGMLFSGICFDTDGRRDGDVVHSSRY